MTLPAFELDDRVWSDLMEEGRSLLPRFAPVWTDHNAHDPGITLIELLAYRTELEMFRLNTITAAHRQAFLALIGKRSRPAGPRPATTLLVFDPALHRTAPRKSYEPGDYFVPRQTATGRTAPRRPSPTEPEIDRPKLPEFGFRAAHALALTGIRLAAVQSFDGSSFADITDLLARTEPAFVWGRQPQTTPRPDDLQPALYLGFDLKLDNGNKVDLTLWILPADASLTSISTNLTDEPQIPIEPAAPPEPAERIKDSPLGFQSFRPASTKFIHHGMRVAWEYQTKSGWHSMSADPAFVDESGGLSRPGRIIIPRVILETIRTNTPRTIGAVASPHHYVRCRLAAGRPDSAPRLRGVFVDAVLVEQWDETQTLLRPMERDQCAPLLLRHLDLSEETEADIEDASNDLVRRGWGPPAAAWGAWHATGPRKHPRKPRKNEDGRQFVRFVVLGVGSGQPDQTFKLPTPLKQTLFEKVLPDAPENPLPIRIITDRLRVWTLEPDWAWKPKPLGNTSGSWIKKCWQPTADLVLCSRGTTQYRYDESSNSLVFGNGETGRVPPPGAVVIASYQWTVAEAANLGANALWGPATDKEPGDPKRPALIPTVQFRNPIACAGGQPSESLAAALSRLAAEFGASQQLIELANQAAASTLDGIDLAGILPPASAVTLLDFECLARSVPGTQIARARAWVDMDPVVPGVRTPGAVTVVVVPQLPADRPEPTPGLIARVATYLHARRPLACRVAVIGPQYVPVRMQVKIHVTTGAATHMRPIAEIAIRDFLHPLRGGPAGAGWPFGRTLHAGELLRVLGMTEGVEHVSGLQIAGPDGVFTQTSIAVPAQALLDLVELNLQIREDA